MEKYPLKENQNTLRTSAGVLMAADKFFINANWEERAETPDQLAARFLRTIDALKQIDPVFDLWTVGAKRPKKFEMIRDHYAAEVAAGVATDDWGEPEPFDGYWFHARTRDVPADRAFILMIHAGSTVGRSFTNSLQFRTGYMTNPDMNFISYRLFHAVLAVIAATWEPTVAAAYSKELFRVNEPSYFSPAWIQYLCPWLAALITPPSGTLAEKLPDGGLLMSATTETFNIDDPNHLAAAREIGAAIAPLDELPWPSERGAAVRWTF